MRKPFIPIFILLAYCAILIKVMVFKDMPTIRIGELMLNFSGTDTGHAPNFIPFKTIIPYLFGHKGLIIAGINLVGNIALLIPVGFLVPFVFRQMTWKKTLLLSVAAGFIIEIMQVLLRVGIFDIDDIILNALGVIIGYWAFLILAKWIRSKKYKTIIAASIIVVAACAAGLYAIYPKEKLRVNTGTRTGPVQNDSGNNNGAATARNADDLCGGTGGTGEIISAGSDTIAIRRNDGVIQQIKLTEQTKVKTSTGPVARSDLKKGERVTVVIDESETASVILVCNSSHPAARQEK